VGVLDNLLGRKIVFTDEMNKYISKMKKIYKAEGFEALIRSISDYVAQNDLPQRDAEALAGKFFEITAGG
jgi:hypothetical protein